MAREATRDELTTMGEGAFALWHFLVRYIVPPAVLVIFVMGVAS
ncbi:MAG: hypothetical protein U5K56_16715 [Halioglobus sp.]|nr:hypothetical protein [Halioglobus sp.]